MHIIVGGTGQVGSAVAHALLRQGEKVSVITRDARKGSELQAAGANVLALDIRDVAALRTAFQTGKRAFLLNPPASPALDIDTEERNSINAIIQALDGSGLEKIVAASTYGAHHGERCGDLTVLYELEQRLRAQPIPCAINRGAYYMSNWTGLAMLNTVRNTGKLPSFLPATLLIPMVSPSDLGVAAARRMMEPIDDMGLHYVEGPKTYSAQDVADAYAQVLQMTVEVDVTPREAWVATFQKFGFSPLSAESFACMTDKLVNGMCDPSDPVVREDTTLIDFIRHSVKQNP